MKKMERTYLHWQNCAYIRLSWLLCTLYQILQMTSCSVLPFVLHLHKNNKIFNNLDKLILDRWNCFTFSGVSAPIPLLSRTSIRTASFSGKYDTGVKIKFLSHDVFFSILLFSIPKYESGVLYFRLTPNQRSKNIHNMLDSWLLLRTQ